MASDLRMMANSAFVDAARMMRSSKASPKIYVYVEDDIDKLFWRSFLRYEEYDCLFVIKVYKVADIEIRGKDAMLQDAKNGIIPLGNRILICIDSDLDLLIDNYHDYTSFLRESPYVITTIWYAIENLKCHPSKIVNYLYKISLTDEITIDVENKIEKVSHLVSSLFLISLVSTKLKDHYYPLSTLGQDLNNLCFDINGDLTDTSLTTISRYVSSHSMYVLKHNDEMKIMKTLLSQRGYKEKDYWCLMRGHDVADRIIKPFVKTIGETIRRNKLQEIGGALVEKDRKKQLEQQYANQTGVTSRCCLGERVENLIRDCDGFEHIPIANEIKKNVKKAILSEELSMIVNAIRKSKSNDTILI